MKLDNSIWEAHLLSVTKEAPVPWQQPHISNVESENKRNEHSYFICTHTVGIAVN